MEDDEDGYFAATVPSLKNCYIQAKTLDKLCLEEESNIILLCCKHRIVGADALISPIYRSVKEPHILV
ncbi:MAG: hypothetical protein C4291_11315 [Candidatus Dadabacteria bacterium]